MACLFQSVCHSELFDTGGFRRPCRNVEGTKTSTTQGIFLHVYCCEFQQRQAILR